MPTPMTMPEQASSGNTGGGGGGGGRITPGQLTLKCHLFHTSNPFPVLNKPLAYYKVYFIYKQQVHRQVVY
jgi:hypothetical protein